MVEGWPGQRLAVKLKLLKVKVKEGAKDNFAELGVIKLKILEELQCLDGKEETGLLSGEERRIGIDLKEEYRRKVREEEIMWRQLTNFRV